MAPPPRRRTSWLEDVPRRLKLSASAAAAYPDLEFRRQQRREGTVYLWQVTLDVPGYDPRRVRVEFRAGLPSSPQVYADGPSGRTASPHRFDDRRLCIWYPSDGPDRRWTPDDGLLVLLGMIAVHLFKEAYWRETGQWLGDEYPHAELTKDDATPRRRKRR